MDHTNKSILIASASVLVGFTLNQVARSSWKKLYDEEPPSTHPSKEIDWNKVVLWSIVTGTVISTAKLATERFLTRKL